MTIDQPLDVLIAHDAWATDQVIASSTSLSDSQLDRPFEMGHGSLRATLVHMVDVVGGWQAAMVDSEDYRYEPLDPASSIAQIAERQSVISKLFAAFCRSGSISDVIHATRGTREISAPRGVLVTHVLTHGTHHRAQALNMLRHLGVKPFPQSGVMQWSIATGAAEMKTVEEKKQ